MLVYSTMQMGHNHGCRQKGVGENTLSNTKTTKLAARWFLFALLSPRGPFVNNIIF